MYVPKIGHVGIGDLIVHGNGCHENGKRGIFGTADFNDASERHAALYDETVQILPPQRLPKKRLTIFRQLNNNSFCTANIAQLAEHLVVAQGVAGSNPVIRPIFRPDFIGAFFVPDVLPLYSPMDLSA